MVSPPDAKQVLNALCRTDFQVFLERVFHTLDPVTKLERAPYLEVLSDHLTQAALGDIRRLLVTIPPRHLKTIAASIALPAWILGHDPTKRIISLSYGQDLSLKYAARFRQIMRAPWYAEVFPVAARSIIRDTTSEMVMKQNGGRVATSLGGTVTGIGGDMIIIDDLMKGEDARSPVERARVHDFYGNTILSRLNDKSRGVIIAIQQRLHEDDLAGHLLELGGYKHLILPAIAEERQVFKLSNGREYRREKGDLLKPRTEPKEVLDELRKSMGGPTFQAQYQQNPTPGESAHVEWSRIQTYEDIPPRDRLQSVVQSWDTALADHPKANYSVGTTWGFDGQSWLLVNLVRVRLSYADLLAKVRLERSRWRPDTILVEQASMGIPLLGDLSRDMRCLSHPDYHAPWCQRIGISPRMSKEERLAAQVERLYSGYAKFPAEAPWLPDLKREMLAFPDATYDDQVDSVSQFLEWAVGRGGRSAIKEATYEGEKWY